MSASESSEESDQEEVEQECNEYYLVLAKLYDEEDIISPPHEHTYY